MGADTEGVVWTALNLSVSGDCHLSQLTGGGAGTCVLSTSACQLDCLKCATAANSTSCGAACVVDGVAGGEAKLLGGEGKTVAELCELCFGTEGVVVVGAATPSLCTC